MSARFSREFLRLWWIALAVKTVLAAGIPLSLDESYYWVWGHHPQLSYFDHPPLVGWLFWLGRWIDFGAGFSRLPGVWLGHATLLIWHRLLAPYLDERQLKLWLAFVLLSPFLGVGSLVLTPDLPLVFFWSLGILALLEALRRGTALSYTALGAVLGLGFCAKYHMVLFVPIAFAWLGFSGRWRELRARHLPLAIVTGLIFCFPVWWWNYRNDWASFAFQLKHGLRGGPWRSSWPLEYVAAQIGLIFPPILILAFGRKEPKEARWLHAFAWLPLLFFLYTSFKARVEANWPIIAHPAVLALAFLNNPASRWIRVTMSVWALVLFALFTQIAYPWIPIDPKKLKTSELTKFDALNESTRDLAPLYAGSYQMAAALSYRQKRMIYKLAGMNRRDFYDFQPMSHPASEVFYVAAEAGHPLPAWVVEKGYEAKLVREVPPELGVYEVRRRAQDPGH